MNVFSYIMFFDVCFKTLCVMRPSLFYYISLKIVNTSYAIWIFTFRVFKQDTALTFLLVTRGTAGCVDGY